MKLELNERIFIAGSTGMAGSAIFRKLSLEGYGLKDNDGCFLVPNRQELDLLDFESVKCWFKKNKPTIVILAAAKVGGILANSKFPADFLLQNIKIQTNIIEAAWKNNVKRLMFLGSSCIYPKFSLQPIKEEYLLTGELEQTNDSYAIAKIAGIKLCQALSVQYGFDAISVMPTNLYGPGDNYDKNSSHVMASFIRRFTEASKNKSTNVTCWGSGSCLREFLHVDDLASAVVYLLRYWDPKSLNAPKDFNGNTLYHLNIGTGKDISIKDLANLISKKTGFRGEILWDTTKPDGTPKKQLDVSQIKSLGWSPSINLDKGIEMVLREVKEYQF